MPTLRDCIGRAGKLISPADAEAMHARSQLYQKDGHSVERAERLAVEHFQSEADKHLDSIYEQAGVKREKVGRETVTPAEDALVGANARGEKLYERKDGSRYRMTADDGKPNFGGDLAPVEAPAPETKPPSPEPPAAVTSITPQERGALEAPAENKPEEKSNALPESKPAKILQREQAPTGETGGGRERVEPSVQGNETPREGEAGQEARPEAVRGEVEAKDAAPEPSVSGKPEWNEATAKRLAQIREWDQELENGGRIGVEPDRWKQIQEEKARLEKLEPKPPPLLTDRAIAAVDKKLATLKAKMKGKVYSATEGLYDAGHIAALEIARLGLKAGRPIEQVIRLAVARFKAKHPTHTPEELKQIEKDVREVVGPEPEAPDQEPGTAKSKVPESLRERGVPAGDVDYNVRHQADRKAEAEKMVAEQGDAAAEKAIADRSLPPDTRVAIGGALIKRKMEALKNATGDEALKIADDIQRITEATQSNVSTESGQGVAMHAAIYQDLGTKATMEYVKGQKQGAAEAIGGKEGVEALKDVKKELGGAKTPAEREAVFEKAKKRYTTKPVRKALGDLQAGKNPGKPVDPAKLKHIAELADRIKKAKNHKERAEAELELADMVNIYKGVSALDMEASILTLSILSGPSTQMANFGGNALNLIAQLGTTAMVNPSKLGPIMKGVMDGIPLGWDQAKSILRTGLGSRDFQDRTTGGGSNPLATVDYARDFPSLNKTVGDVLTQRAHKIEWISRFTKAADAVFYYPAREAYARLVATKLLEGEFKGAELARKVSEALHTTPEAFEAARKQAAGEGYDGVSLGRRVADIIEEQRAGTKDGKQVVKESERFAAEATYNNEPVGLAGVIYRNLARTVKDADVAGVPVLKPWAMFLRVPANVLNATTNFTPLGASRAIWGMKGEGYRRGADRGGEKQWRHFTKDEQNRLYLQSVIGSTLMGGLTTLILQNKDIGVSASGPSDPSHKRQLQATGWRPYSIKIGNKYISYKDSPLLVPLALVGHVADSIKYQKNRSGASPGEQVLTAVARTFPAIFETSMLSGLSNLMSAMSGKGGDVMSEVGRTLGSIPANLIIPYNRALQQVDQVFDSHSYKNDVGGPIAGSVAGAVPFLRREGTPLKDVQGRASEYNPFNRFASQEKNDVVDAVLRAKNIFIPEVGDDNKIGNRVMTEAEHDKYRQLSGARIRVRLQSEAPRLRALSQEKAQDRVKQITREERARVKPLIGRK